MTLQSRILTALRNAKGAALTTREIRDRCGVWFLVSVYYDLRRLEDAGHVVIIEYRDINGRNRWAARSLKEE